MKPDERKSHRLKYLLKIYLNNVDPEQIYHRAILMGVTPKTAKLYCAEVIQKARTMYKPTY